jgi:hypothetical protein
VLPFLDGGDRKGTPPKEDVSVQLRFPQNQIDHGFCSALGWPKLATWSLLDIETRGYHFFVIPDGVQDLKYRRLLFDQRYERFEKRLEPRG